MRLPPVAETSARVREQFAGSHAAVRPIIVLATLLALPTLLSTKATEAGAAPTRTSFCAEVHSTSRVLAGKLWDTSHVETVVGALVKTPFGLYCDVADRILPKLADTTVPSSGVYRGPWEGGFVCRGTPKERKPTSIVCLNGSGNGFQSDSFQPWAKCHRSTDAKGRVWELSYYLPDSFFGRRGCGSALWILKEHATLIVPRGRVFPGPPSGPAGFTPDWKCIGGPEVGELPLRLFCEGSRSPSPALWLRAHVAKTSVPLLGAARKSATTERPLKPKPKPRNVKLKGQKKQRAEVSRREPKP